MLDAGSLDDVVTGYACIGLGLMGYRNASDQLADVLEDSVRRPSLFRQAATGLVLLRGADAIAIVRESIGAGDLNVARRRLCAETFGHLRSKRAGEPLLAMLASRDLSPQTRAVAVVSLGSIFYRGELPWSARIAENMNYVSAISALSQPATDLLPIL